MALSLSKSDLDRQLNKLNEVPFSSLSLAKCSKYEVRVCKKGTFKEAGQ